MAEGSGGAESSGRTLGKQFHKFCNFGNHSKTEKKTLSDKNLTKMFKDCKIYGKSLTTTDTDIAFSKVKEKGKKEITLGQFKELIKTIAPKYQKDKSLESSDVAVTAITSTITDHDPGLRGTTKIEKMDVVDRMTDTSNYTGTHRERFDDSGKGKGIAGREEVNAKDGYVQGYKDRGTYEKKVKAN